MVCKGRAQGSELRDILRASIVTLSMDAIRARSRSRRVGPFLWPPGELHIRSNDQGTCAGSSGLASIKRGSTGEDKISIRICWPAGGRAQERRAPTASRPCHDRRTALVARVRKHEMSELFMDKPLPLSALPVKPVRFVAKLAQRNTLAP